MQSPITNDCFKVNIDGQSETQMVPTLLLQVSVWEIQNRMVVLPEEIILKESFNEENNIIISDSMLCNILPPQLKKMYDRYKLICGCECCISAESMYSFFLS